MSGLSDFFTQAGFWWGTPFGAIVAAPLGAVVNARTTRASDERKAAQEEKMDSKKSLRENRQSQQKLIRETTTAYGEVCSAILEKAIDNRGIYNAIRDAALTANCMPDALETEKVEFAVDLMDEVKKLTTAYNNLRLVAPASVMDKATALNAAIIELAKQTTSPLTKPPLMAAAGRAFDDFANAVRGELDLDAYTPEDAARANAGYVETLQKQVEDYIAEAKADAQKLGFLDLGSAEVVQEGEFEIRPPGALGVTPIKAGDLTQAHIGQLIGCHHPLGYNYGAKITRVKRDEDSPRPGMLVSLRHPPSLDGSPAREDHLRLRFDEDLELVDLPAAE